VQVPVTIPSSSSSSSTAENGTNGVMTTDAGSSSATTTKYLSTSIYWDVESKAGPSPIDFVDALSKRMPSLACDPVAKRNLILLIASQLSDPDGSFATKYAAKPKPPPIPVSKDPIVPGTAATSTSTTESADNTNAATRELRKVSKPNNWYTLAASGNGIAPDPLLN